MPRSLPFPAAPVLAALLLAPAAPAVVLPQDGHILRLDDNPDEEIWELQTRVRHTTVITLPARETILDYVVGDAENLHLSGSANVAFLKPIAPDVATNIALVCESGRIYTFLVAESSELTPHLVVRFHDPRDASSSASSNTAPRPAHEPAFVARSQVQSYQAMAQQARADAEDQVAAARQAATREIDAYRAAYPLRIQFPYTLENKARDWPFLVTAMWHDQQFTYLRSGAQESPALYEEKDGEPSLLPYDLTETGLFIVRRVVGDGWLEIGEERARWRFTPADPLP